MSFRGLVSDLDDLVLDTFSSSPVDPGTPLLVTIHPQDGDIDFSLSAVVKNPVFEEDFIPGSPTTGVASLLLFCRPSADMPVKGDTATVSDIDYDLYDVGADREGGFTLKLRQRTEPWRR